MTATPSWFERQRQLIPGAKPPDPLDIEPVDEHDAVDGSSEQINCADPSAPWMKDPMLGGMSPAARRASWEAGQARAAADAEWQASHAPPNDDAPPYDSIPDWAAGGATEPAERLTALLALGGTQAPANFRPITPAAWRGTEPPVERWLAQDRILAGDLTILSGNGGCGKTEIAAQLLVSVAAGLGDWLGCVVDHGPVLFVSCEEPEENIRNRVERICKHRDLDPYDVTGLHMHFPELDGTWLCQTDRAGKVTRTPLLVAIERWIAETRPALVVIDSVAAVFDGDAINRRQVRAFLALLRQLARQTGVAVLLLDHPSVRGMADGTGTANSVDWRNSVRGMMYLSDPPKDDPDARTLSFTKNNRGRKADDVNLQWSGLTFTPVSGAMPSPVRAAAERDVDDLFLRLLDKRNAQGRPVRPATGRGSAPSEFADDSEANGIKAPAFRAAMERHLSAGTIRVVESGPPSKRTKHLERAIQ